jgi:uncharacterized protein YjbI with pentapeptide repeats
MIIPARAPVRPRVISPEGGGSILLEEVVADFQDGTEEALVVFGGIGWGKSMALAHLADRLGDRCGITFLDEPLKDTAIRAISRGKTVITTGSEWQAPTNYSFCRFTLAPWSNDDLIEYLLSEHRPECGSVMKRITSAADRTMHKGQPGLCALVLERMAEDESLVTVAAALRREINGSVTESESLQAARQFSIAMQLFDRAGANESYNRLKLAAPDDRAVRLLRHDAVRLLLAADGLAAALETPGDCPWLKRILPRRLVEITGPLLSEAAIVRLQVFSHRRDRSRHAMAASLISATGQGWVPERYSGCDLTGAYLAGSNWTGLHAKEIVLNNCDMGGSNLTDAMLEKLTAIGANFTQAVIRDAWLIGLNACGSQFQGADLSSIKAEYARLGGSNFTDACLRGACLHGATLAAAALDGACFDEANLSKAELHRSKINGASFVGANLEEANLNQVSFRTAKIDGANFYCAQMIDCDFENCEVAEVSFVGADLRDANFTSSRMPGANFANANFSGAKLGDVNWQGANLTYAKLRDCTFHFGSSRSGLVNSTIAGEGSKTDFYTDEFDQQTYRPAEEIRKANLCDVDLTGADLTATDFYLVDLRGAKYSTEQFEYLRKCGAILFDRE